MGKISVLFARKDSVYKTIPGADVWDLERDALSFPGGNPCVAHPPCRLWGALKGLSTAPESEKALALFAVRKVRKWGGVLEHPAHSKLWQAAGLPLPSEPLDSFGGFSIALRQWVFGHRAEKWTWLYICGVPQKQIPDVPSRSGEITHVITQSLRKNQPGWRPRVTTPEREHTPIAFALWLIEVANLCNWYS